jgi:hypothetical protein
MTRDSHSFYIKKKKSKINEKGLVSIKLLPELDFHVNISWLKWICGDKMPEEANSEFKTLHSVQSSPKKDKML